MTLGKTLVTMLAGGTAYATFAVVINYALKDSPLDGDTKLAFFFIGLGIAGKYLHDREQRQFF